MITRISSAITQLTWDLSALGGKPAALSVAAYFAWSNPLSSTSPIFVTIVSALPAGRSVDLKEMPCLVRKSLALSQSLNFDHGPTKMWNLQSFAATVIGVLAV